jgi:hypothetical protein
MKGTLKGCDHVKRSNADYASACRQPTATHNSASELGKMETHTPMHSLECRLLDAGY